MVNAVVEREGDGPIPVDGMRVSCGQVSVKLESDMRYPLNLLYSQSAAILRGLWVLSVNYESCTLTMDIYIGGRGPAGRVTLYNGATASNASE